MPPCLPIIKNVVPEIKFPFQEARMFGTKFRYIVLTVKHCFSSGHLIYNLDNLPRSNKHQLL
jgi:hypothetical protein